MKIGRGSKVSWLIVLVCLALIFNASNRGQATNAESAQPQPPAPEYEAQEKDVPHIKQIDDREPGKVTIEVESARPLKVIADMLQERYDIVISYEDAPYEHPSDMMNMIFTRRASDLFEPGKEPHTIIPRPTSLKMTFAAPQEKKQPPDLNEVIPALIAAHNAAGNPGKFIYERDDYGFHIVPFQVRTASGEFKKIDSMLKVRISMPAMERTIDNALVDLCSAISQVAPYKVQYAATLAHRNSFLRRTCKVGATDEPAREILEKILLHPYCWQLLYGISAKAFVLSIK